MQNSPQNKKDGRSYITLKGTYLGAWGDNNQPNGYGEITFKSGGTVNLDVKGRIIETYKGNWVNGEMSGWGTMTYTDGSYYQGDFSGNMRNGRGYFADANNGNTYAGPWKNNQPNGEFKIWDYLRTKAEGKDDITLMKNLKPEDAKTKDIYENDWD